jgi:hypothetical protein
MLDFTTHFSTRLTRLATPQAERIPGTNQVPNSAGGYAWPVDKWTRFDRFLIFGSERGTYYIRERTLTVENATNARECITDDGPRAVRRIVEISAAGRAPSNDPALFELAMCAGLGNDATHAMALEALPEVARTGTHLFHFLQYVPHSAGGDVECVAPSDVGTRRSRRRPSRTRSANPRRGTGGRTATLCVSPTRRRPPSRTTCCSVTRRRGGTACWSWTG